MSEQSGAPGAWDPFGAPVGDDPSSAETVDLRSFDPPPPATDVPFSPAMEPAEVAASALFGSGGPSGPPTSFGAPPPVSPGPVSPGPVTPPPVPSAPPLEPALFTAAVPPGPLPVTPPQPSRPMAMNPAAAGSKPSKPPAASPSKRRQTILLAVLGVVIVGAAIAFFLLRGGDEEPLDTVTPATTAMSATTVAPAGGEAVAPPGGGATNAAVGTARSGNGTGTVELTFPEPKPTMVFLALSSTQSGPFTVTTIGADGSQGARMVEAHGPFEGNRMLLPSADGSLPTKVEVVAPGAWTLDVRDVTTAVQAGVNAGTGSTVLYYRGAGGELGFSHDGPGSFVIRSYQTGQPQDLVSVTGPNQGTAQLPGGPYPIEIVTDGSWLLTAQQ